MPKYFKFRALPIQIKLSEDASGTKVPDRVQVIRCGDFDAGAQGKITITPEILLAFKKNFDAKVRKIDLAIDYAHDSNLEAAAWIKGVTLSDDGQSLWLDVEWTPRGEKTLADKEFRYLSADFTFNYEDNETKTAYGPTLLGAGLTNRPVIKGMEPVVQLSEEKQMDPKDKKIEELEAQVAELQKKLETQAGENPPPAKKKKDASADNTDATDDADGDGDEATLAMKNKMAAMQSKLDEYAEKEKKAAEEKACAEKKSEFEKMLSEGKCVEAQRESFMKNDMAEFLKNQMPVKFSEIGHGKSQKDGEGAGSDDTATGKIMSMAKKLSEEKKIDLSTAIAQVRRENTKLAEEHDKQFVG